MLKIRQALTGFSLLIAFSVFGYAQKTPKADYSKNIQEATPKSLPQTPVAEKLKSDAEDDNLKGKIKSLVVEIEEFSEIGKRLSQIADFDEKGNRLKEIDYEFRGIPYSVTVYGYIDRARVSNSNSINRANVLSVAGTKPKIKDEKRKDAPDTRYEYKYEYKYINGKLAEMQMFDNSGVKGMRYVYNYNGRQTEELVYTDDGTLNQKYLITLDDKGNEIESVYFDVSPQKLGKDTKYVYKYDSFDKEGNWTRRTASELESENGKQNYKLISTTYRTITYYQ